MKKDIKILFIVVLFLNAATVCSQQVPVFSQYNVNKFLLNPAVAGGNNYTTVNMVARQQYLGLENAPRTFALTAQTRLLSDSYIMRRLQVRNNVNQKSRIANIGIGANIFSDRNGYISKTGIQLTYAYHVNFNNNFQLSMGLAGTAFQFKLNDEGAYIADPADPLLLGNDKQFWVPDATFGVYITNSKLYGGFALTDLFGSALKLGADRYMENFETARNFNLMGGYRYELESGFMIEPSTYIRVNKYHFLADINTRVFYRDEYWFGLSYRTNNSLVMMVGLSYDMFYFGYAYDASLGTIRNYSSGSHEIMLGVRFGDNSTRRFRWLKKDDVEFDI